jgi:hypothetical protein
VKEWLTSVGLSGIILSAGYTAEMGRESLLGIEVSDFNFGRYASAFAAFLLDSIEIVSSHWLGSALTALAVASLFVTLSRLEPRGTTAKLTLGALALCVLVGSPFVLVRDEIPAVRIGRVLMQNATLDEFGENLGSREMWRKLLCAHDLDHKLGCASKNPPYHEGDTDQLKTDYFLVLLKVAALGVALAGFGMLAGSVKADATPGATPFLSSRSLSAVMGALLVVDVLMLPYVHAKLLSNTRFPRVVIRFESADLPTSKENTKDPCADPVGSAEGFLLHEGDRFVTLYQTICPTLSVVTNLAVSKLLTMKSTDLDDAISYHIKLTGPKQPTR